MSTDRTSKTISKKEEKRDYKQELLEKIIQKAGLDTGIVMEKALKTQDKQIEEAMTQGGMTAKDIAQSRGMDLDLLDKLVNTPDTAATAPTSTPQGSPQETLNQLIQSKPASSPFGFGGMSSQNGQLTEQQPGLLAGLLSMIMTGRPNAAANLDLNKLTKVTDMQQNQAQTGYTQQQTEKTKQQMSGEEPLQKGRKEELGIEQQNFMDRLDTEYNYKAQIEAIKLQTDPNNPEIKSQIFQDDLINFIDAFEAIPIKGRGLGGISAGLASIGIGKQERAKYEQMSEAFVYSFASYIAQQQGRALDKDEVKRFREMIKLKTGDTRGQILGKVQAMIELANNRAKTTGGKLLPDAKTLIDKLRQNRQSNRQPNIQMNKMGKDVSSIQSELDDINRKLREFGE